MSKHTPGPWVVGELNKGPVAGTVPVHTADYMESYRSGQLVCSVYGTAAFSYANARLIAAAPELLEALDDIIGMAQAGRMVHVINRAKAAIAKAKGE